MSTGNVTILGQSITRVNSTRGRVSHHVFVLPFNKMEDVVLSKYFHSGEAGTGRCTRLYIANTQSERSHEPAAKGRSVISDVSCMLFAKAYASQRSLRADTY